MVWQKLATKTLGADADDLDIGDVTPLLGKKFLQILAHTLPSGVITEDYTFNNDGGVKYARRSSTNGGADTTNVSATKLELSFSAIADQLLGVHYALNINTEEKLGIYFLISDNAATGAGNPPVRGEFVYKFTETVNQITRIDINNVQAGSYATDSNLTALGTD